MSKDYSGTPYKSMEPTANLSAESLNHADRLAHEWQLAEDTFANEEVQHTVPIFGSARIPEPNDSSEQTSSCQQMSSYYAAARALAFQLGQYIEQEKLNHTRLITGGGPGIMEAASRGAFDAGHSSIGLNIKIPREQQLNPFIAAKHSIEFQYFALRKMHFLKRSRALVVFPGGFGTLDELFETLTLIQTKKLPHIPIVLYGADFWHRLFDFTVLSECGLIDQTNLALYHVVDTVEEALEIVLPVLSELKP